MSCIFCQIIKKEMPADIIYENEQVVAFKDIHPKAPLHFLIIPKKHIPSVDHLEEEDKELMGELVLSAKKIAKEQGVSAAYKLVFNVGRAGGQIIDHIHLHLLAGWKSDKERDIPGMP
ncbi:histidine triad nucleotide-binding protein [Candidatus Parcubacteria bacterium]|nr:histidine triad nucleotide-binding protein [Candidatus Parcubacteria bacterium]